jgi:protocatechuate 3,4-dioxygenase alpha subunit
MQTDEDFGPTPSQTIGPFFHYGLPWKGGADLVGSSDMGARADLFPAAHYLLAPPAVRSLPQGEVIEITGRVLDGKGAGVPDAMIEIWQANAAGRYCSSGDARTQIPLDPHFVGFGRSSTSADGEYRFRTVRPGRVPGRGSELQAPHVAVSIFGRGLLNRLITRLYFADGEGNDSDPVLSAVPEQRRKTLIATSVALGSWHLDLVLQGSDETVFFSL